MNVAAIDRTRRNIAIAEQRIILERAGDRPRCDRTAAAIDGMTSMRFDGCPMVFVVAMHPAPERSSAA